MTWAGYRYIQIPPDIFRELFFQLSVNVHNFDILLSCTGAPAVIPLFKWIIMSI